MKHGVDKNEGDGLVGLGDAGRCIWRLLTAPFLFLYDWFSRRHEWRGPRALFMCVKEWFLERWRRRLSRIKTSGAALARTHHWRGIRRTLSVACLFWIIWALVAGIAEFVDPFGLSDNADRKALTLAARIFAPLYESAYPKPVVLLITDNTLEQRKMSWPPPYRFYLDLFRDLEYAHPSSVFLDIVIANNRGNPREREKIRKQLAQTIASFDFPVFAAQFSDEDHNLLAGMTNVEMTPVRWRLANYLYPIQVGAAETASGFNYIRPRASPALLQYRAACDDAPLQNCDPRLVETRDDAYRQLPPMLVKWGESVRSKWLDIAYLSDEDKHRCGLVDPSPWQRWKGVWDTTRGYAEGAGAIGSDDSLRSPCPYIPYFAAQHINRKTIDYMQGRPILIGTGMTGDGDLRMSPVHGLTPGVFFHAMALDNLLTYGNRYGTYTEHTLGRIALWASAAFVMALALVACRRAQLARRYFIASATLVVVGAFIIGQKCFGRAIVDWPYIILLCSAGLYFIHRSMDDRHDTPRS